MTGILLLIAIVLLFGLIIREELRPKHTEPNPVYSKPFWRQVREDNDDDSFNYPGPMPM